MQELRKSEAWAPVASTVIRQVLIVDDSRAHLRMMARVLGRWGVVVREAMSGAEALSILEEGGIDLVLSDWVMLGMTGLELCTRARTLELDGYVYFILLTSKSDRADVAAGLEAGADDFLSKPINVEELRARISAGERLIAIQRALEERNGQLGTALEELQTVYDAIARDLGEARRLQQSLVPEETLSFDGADVALRLRPSGHVGGDLVGCFVVRETELGIYSLDVSGHGIASALMTARLASYLSNSSHDRNIAIERIPDVGLKMRAPEVVAADLNRLINQDLETELYFTMVLAVCDLTTGAVRLVQAGHPHPMILRANGTVERLGEGGLPIGLVEAAEFECSSAVMAPGDRSLLYSDGFLEQEDPNGRMLEDEGFEALVRSHGVADPEETVCRLLEGLAEHAGARTFADDVSCALFDFTGYVANRDR